MSSILNAQNTRAALRDAELSHEWIFPSPITRRRRAEPDPVHATRIRDAVSEATNASRSARLVLTQRAVPHEGPRLISPHPWEAGCWGKRDQARPFGEAQAAASSTSLCRATRVRCFRYASRILGRCHRIRFSTPSSALWRRKNHSCRKLGIAQRGTV